jgi:hypothetical protein
MNKENPVGNKNPMFLRVINRESSFSDLVRAFSNSSDPRTAEIAIKAMNNPIDLEPFRVELEEAVRDIIKTGYGEEFKAFVNHYMEPSLTEEQKVTQGPLGESRVQVATIKDEKEPWIQGFICYNLCLYIKAFGTEDLKSCKTCGKLFDHKGKFATYCSDDCKKDKGRGEKQSSGIFKTKI